MVMQHGVEHALRPDRNHYQDEFSYQVGQALVDFVEQVLVRKAA